MRDVIQQMSAFSHVQHAGVLYNPIIFYETLIESEDISFSLFNLSTVLFERSFVMSVAVPYGSIDA